MKPRKNYRSRPVKSGAKKTQKVNAQKRRLLSMGEDQAKVEKMTPVEARNALKVTAKKVAKIARIAKAAA